MLKAKQRFGKYVIERKLGEGGYAVVYQARDTIEGVRVALKIPHAHLVNAESMEEFRREVRLAAKLEHPNILPLKYADYVDGHFAIVTALAEATLENRLHRRLSTDLALDFCWQMLQAVAHAHARKIIHCDLKPDNFLIFTGNRLRLTDFGIARAAQKTIRGSGAGTVGYIAPEQAMGRPSFRSDVFSLGLIIHRMLAGELPEWPFEWPFVGYDRLKGRINGELISVIRRATEVQTRKRYKDAGQLLAAFSRIRNPRKPAARREKAGAKPRDWKAIRQKEFQRKFGRQLEVRHECPKCRGPVSEVMRACPWCGRARQKHPVEEPHRFTVSCPRCNRGLKADWSYCPWCFGPGFLPSSNRALGDKRYGASCSSSRCTRRKLMPFMRYCPWCRTRVRKPWKLTGSADRCSHCKCGVTLDYWAFCPWCTKRLKSRS